MTAPELSAAIAATSETWMRTLDLAGPAIAAHRLTSATFQVLWVVDPAEPPPSMNVVAERLHCNAPNLTFMVNHLAERGLVERAVDPHDRRSRVLLLTAKGRQVRDEVLATVLRQSPLAALDAAELKQLLSLLNKALS